MSEVLLAGSMSTVLIGAVGAAAALSFVYGIFKKSSRIGWAGWQTLLVFAFTFVLGAVRGSGVLVFLFAVGCIFVLTAGLYYAESKLKRRIGESVSSGGRTFDRVWGAVTAAVNGAVFVASVGAFVLCLAGFAAVSDSLKNHLMDLPIAAILVCAFRGGHKLGLIKALWAIAGLAATGGAFLGAVSLTGNVGFLKSFAGTLKGGFMGLGEGVAAIMGSLFVVILCFLVLFAVIVGVFWLLSLLVKKLDRSRTFTAIDNSLLAVLLFLVAVLLLCGVNYGVYMLINSAGGMLGGMGEAVGQYLEGVGQAFASSPLGRIFYEYNPIRLITGG